MESVTDIATAGANGDGGTPEEAPHEPRYAFRTLNGNDTLRIWRMVTGLADREQIRDAVAEGGMEGAQQAVIRTLLSKIEGEFLPLMVGMVEGEKERFKLPRKLPDDRLEEDEEEADARARIVEERLEEWLEGQPMDAIPTLFADFVAHEDFLAVFVSASKAAGSLKRIAGVFGIDLGKAMASLTESSDGTPSDGSDVS